MTRLARSAFALLLATAVPAVAQVAPTFSTKTEMVRVDVLVTAGGQPVTGLRPGDFEVIDSGVSQTVDLVSFEQLPLNVVLALDLSESVAGERLAHLTTASRAVLERLNRGDQVALVSFSHVVALGRRTDGRRGRDRARARPRGTRRRDVTGRRHVHGHAGGRV